ncbi:hypothetical protein CWO08_08755 [Vibrio sp. 10N.286.48.B8]|uniref:hypothetical protein n=1 Tax=Vibrio sp. 10N.286.48.B8 TaxID=2056189 RepID=UPI000D3AD0AD|nr:hypothetical protein [Vibrio sp. 10N.286.48.B8]PTO96320.1 hypothetical protein CWO08_08755 [Vibrio sp. 10N.286.48.B8]
MKEKMENVNELSKGTNDSSPKQTAPNTQLDSPSPKNLLAFLKANLKSNIQGHATTFGVLCISMMAGIGLANGLGASIKIFDILEENIGVYSVLTLSIVFIILNILLLALNFIDDVKRRELAHHCITITLNNISGYLVCFACFYIAAMATFVREFEIALFIWLVSFLMFPILLEYIQKKDKYADLKDKIQLMDILTIIFVLGLFTFGLFTVGLK